MNDYGLFYSVTVFLMMIVLLVLAWVACKYIKKKSFPFSKSKTFDIVDKAYISQDKLICSILVRNKLVITAMSSHSIQKLCEFDLSEDELKNFSQKDAIKKYTTIQSFKDILSKQKGDK